VLVVQLIEDAAKLRQKPAPWNSLLPTSLFIPPSDSAFADIVRVYKLHLLVTYLLTYSHCSAPIPGDTVQIMQGFLKNFFRVIFCRFLTAQCPQCILCILLRPVVYCFTQLEIID